MHATQVFFPQTLQLPLTSLFRIIDPQDSQQTNIQSLFQSLDKTSGTKHFAIQQNQALVAAQLSAAHAFASKILQRDGMPTISADKSKVHSRPMTIITYHIY
jgi:hypothetical protein